MTLKKATSDLALAAAALTAVVLLVRSAEPEQSTPSTQGSGVAPRPPVEVLEHPTETHGRAYPSKSDETSGPSNDSFTPSGPTTGETEWRNCWMRGRAFGKDVLVVLYESADDIGNVLLTVPEEEYVICSLPIEAPWNDTLTNGQRWNTDKFYVVRYDIETRTPYEVADITSL